MAETVDAEFTKWLVTLGVGGVLAAVIFMFYRKDVKSYTELWRSTAEQLINVIKENTASNIKLIAMLENQERNSMRKQDIEFLVERRIRDLRYPRLEKDISGNAIDER